ncbi:MAG: peptidase E [Alphaproteobacteria bacterium]|nr:peptidase E [Alphaproteobacteria bacterium]
MKLILGGGGSGEQTALSNKLFDEIIDNSKPVLYVPLARDGDYAGCLEWVTGELAGVRKAGIDMVQSGAELAAADLSKYAGIFIGGGNTYKLLKILKETGAFDKIKNYLARGGVVYGGSAGSVIFGRSIDIVKYMDTNDVGLSDLSGFDMIDGASLAPHYTNGNSAETKAATEFLKEYSKNEWIVAIPEENSIFINDGIKVIGTKNWYMFQNGEYKMFDPFPLTF